MTCQTQMEAARQGVLTSQMEHVLEDESISRDLLLERVALGQIAIPANKLHTNLRGGGIGRGLRTKINVNLGVSQDCCNLDMEMRKVQDAVDLKTDAIMDLSTFGDTRAFRRKVISMAPVMVGTVPVYDALAGSKVPLPAMTVDQLFETVIVHAEDGVDFMTIHAGLTRMAVERLHKNPRLTHVVSRWSGCFPMIVKIHFMNTSIVCWKFAGSTT